MCDGDQLSTAYENLFAVQAELAEMKALAQQLATALESMTKANTCDSCAAPTVLRYCPAGCLKRSGDARTALAAAKEAGIVTESTHA